MKEEVFKVNYENYECVIHKNSSCLTSRPMTRDSQLFSSKFLTIEKPNTKKPKNKLKVKKPLLFIKDTTSNLQSDYVENYGNPLARISKNYAMVVVEKWDDKVSLKLFRGSRVRQVGNSWFKINRHVNYITVNLKTGDVYSGLLYNFQKKNGATKKINKNYFSSSPINSMMYMLRSALSGYNEKHYEISVEAVSKFISEIYNKHDELDFEKKLFKFYLDKKQIKYPNNFYLYANELVGSKIRKTLKKSDNKLVDAFMKEKGIVGKKVKVALHNCDRLNTSMYLGAKKLFGNDWINQEPDFILSVLNTNVSHSMYEIPSEFTNVISKEELRRVFKLYKKVHFSDSINPRTYYDHIRMYTELKMYGENDLKWVSDGENDDNNVFFRNEHLNWTDKIQFYKKGNYKRIYPEYLYDIIKEPIMGYYPVVLDTTSNYNEESSVQSNCVKTYVGSAQSLIISLRKDSVYSNERATIEYEIYRQNDIMKCKRVQSLGRFNQRLELDWSGVLFKLDDLLLSYINDKRFDTVKLIKEYSNGTIINSDSEWSETGKLIWGNRHINSVNDTVINWM